MHCTHNVSLPWMPKQENGKSRVQEMCGETWFAEKVAKTCAGDLRGILLCSKDGKKRVREMCGEICCAPKVATHVCGNCAGGICCVAKVAEPCAGNVRGDLLSSTGGKNVCGKCAGNFAVFQR